MNVAIIFNKPEVDRYQTMGESRAELGVIDEVQAVSRALTELKHSFFTVPLRPPLDRVKETLGSLDADVVFNLFEGFDGIPETESIVVEMLAELKIPFTGCPAPALAIALDKSRTKEILHKAGIGTPRYQVLTPDSLSAFHLEYPCIVKPLADDASHGISEESVVHNFAGLEKQVGKIGALFGGGALVEEYIDGREFNTTVLGNTGLIVPAVSEITYNLPPDKPRILTFESKWEEGSDYFKNTRAVCPAPISQEEREKIACIAMTAFKLTGCRGYARVDFRQASTGDYKVLEVNPNPDITPGSGAALQVEAAGMTYSQFIEKIIRYAVEQ